MRAIPQLRRLAPAQLLPLFAIALEVLWAYPWLIWAGKWPFVAWPRPPLTLAGAVILAIAAEGVARLALESRWSLGRVRALVLPALLLILALVVRLGVGGDYALWEPGWGGYAAAHASLLAGGLAFGVFLLWRGIAVGRESLTFDDVYRRFLLGLTALVVLLVLWGATSRSDGPKEGIASVGLYVAAYFAVGLVAIALASFQSIQERMLLHEAGLFSRRWLSLLLAVVLAIVGISLAIASAFSFDLVTLLAHPLGILANWLLTAFLYAVALPLGFVAAGMVYALRFLIQLLRREPPEPFKPPNFDDFRKASEGHKTGGIPPEAIVALKWGLLALLLLLVLVILARALLRYWRAKSGAEVEEVSESLWSWETFKADIRRFLARLLARFRRAAAAVVAPATPPLAATRTDGDRLFTIREIYQGLLWEGRHAGVPRRAPETPYEYERKLKGRIETRAEHLAAITEAYVGLRYGGIETDGGQLGLLNRLWQQLRAALRGEETTQT
ncbi:MAG: DUF4129 domain-containing protein [Chloroflexi bacterium]|nr:DUF4129 domain-containing protein [Chloroflexota bacterium]